MNQLRKRWLRWLAAALLFVPILMIGIGISTSWYERSKAQKLLSILSGVRVGSSSQADVMESTKNFRTFQVSQPGPDPYGLKTDAFGFHNGSSWFLHLLPEKVAIITVGYAGGKVVEKGFMYQEAPGLGATVREELEQPAAAKSSSERLEKDGRLLSLDNGAPPYSSSSPAHIASVIDETSVPLTQRQHDWQINLDCMTRLALCENMRSVLTGALQESSFEPLR